MTYYALYKLIIMCVKQKCKLFNVQKYDIMLISIILCEFPMILAEF